MKLISVNIERSKHLDRVIPFLQNEQPEVVCMQELLERDIARLSDALDAVCAFEPCQLYPGEGLQGVGIFSKEPLTERSVDFYWRARRAIRDPFALESTEAKRETEHHLVLSGIVRGMRVATTHFTWTPNGEADEYQREDLAQLLTKLDGLGEFALCGDFNAPRGREIFEAIAAKYTDNIPKEYETSIDKDLHKAGALPYMVDGLFTTPSIVASNVHLVSGVSDHMAIVADIASL
jgi:exonuclease III